MNNLARLFTKISIGAMITSVICVIGSLTLSPGMINPAIAFTLAAIYCQVMAIFARRAR